MYSNKEDFRDPVSAEAPAGSRYIDSKKIAWQQTETEKFWIKPLYENAGEGERTLLMKVEPGAFAPLHAHDDFEQFYILEGSLIEGERVLRSGDYVCRAPGAMHSVSSSEGALLLLIYTKSPQTRG